MNKNNISANKFVKLMEIGFGEKQIGKVLEISPKLLTKTEKLLYWEDKMMIFDLGNIWDDLPLYMILGLDIYLWLWIFTKILRYFLGFMYNLNMFWIYAIAAVIIMLIGKKNIFLL